jgi:hypothetical protein
VGACAEGRFKRSKAASARTKKAGLGDAFPPSINSCRRQKFFHSTDSKLQFDRVISLAILNNKAR